MLGYRSLDDLKKQITILADSDFKFFANLFTPFADIEFIAGRSIDKKYLSGFDALLVRSVTKVNKELICGSGLKFVGTATSGVEHIDQEALAKAGISFSSAKGANADSVCDYVIAALVALDSNCQNFTDKFLNRSYGIIGAGEVGHRLITRLMQCGVRDVLVYDPPLREEHDSENRLIFSTLDEVLSCNVVSVHAPLETSGSYPTTELLGAHEINGLQTGTILVNASRGGILDEVALLTRLKSEAGFERNERLSCVLDVWDSEPLARKSLVEAVDIATPHIAGYSAQAKQNAIEILRGKLIETFDIEAKLLSSESSRSTALSEVLPRESLNDPVSLISALYPLKELSEQMKYGSMHSKGPGFDAQRSKLRERNEFQTYVIDQFVKLAEADRQFLKGLGFRD